MHMDINTLGFANLGETLAETTLSESQEYTEVVGSTDSRVLQALTFPSLRPPTSSPPAGSYLFVL